MDRRELERRFHAAAEALGAQREVPEVFARVHAAYAEPHRVYHGLSHLAHALGELERLAVSLEAPAEVELALFFHDVVYDPAPGSDSEERSAQVAEEACRRMGIDQGAAHRIATLVRATAGHALPEGAGDEALARSAEALFDVDLAILGAEPSAYDAFERGIRAEHAAVPEELFRSGRARVLAAFLGRPRIYHHPEMRDRLEARARENLRRAIAALGGTAAPER